MVTTVAVGPMPGMMLFSVDTIRTQAWMDHVLHDLHPCDPGGMSLHTGKLYEHQDYLEQLLNEAVATRLDSTNHERDVYERIDTNVPNDYRDCHRYAYAAMVIATRNRPVRPRSGERPKKRHAVLSTGVGDGRGSWR
jgi:hypothetical protein